MKKTKKTNSLFSIDKQGFTAYLESKNLKKSTQKGFLMRTELFAKWYTSTGSVTRDPLNCTKKDILSYLEHLKNKKNLTNFSRFNYLSAIKHYFEYLKNAELIPSNPAALIKMRGISKKTLPSIYTMQELGNLNDNFYKSYVLHFDESKIKKHCVLYSRLNRNRNYLMLSVLIYQGVANAELEKIELSDLDFTKATLRIKANHHRNERILPLKAAQIGALMNFIHVIRPQFFEFCEPSKQLFLPLRHAAAHNTKTNAKGLLTSMQRFRKQMRDLDKNFEDFQQIRTSVITHWIRTEGLRKAQYYAGHKYIRATEYYLPNDFETLADDIAKHHPLT